MEDVLCVNNSEGASHLLHNVTAKIVEELIFRQICLFYLDFFFQEGFEKARRLVKFYFFIL